MWSGRAFQVTGPACENARSPNLCANVVESSPSMRWNWKMSHISYPGEMVDVDVCTFAVMSYHVSSKFKIWNTLSIESTLVFKLPQCFDTLGWAS